MKTVSFSALKISIVCIVLAACFMRCGSDDAESISKAKKDCRDAYRYADDAYSKAYMAYNAYSLENAKMYIQQAQSASGDAQRAARDCGCDDAARDADDAYTKAGWGYSASSLDQVKSYAWQAKSAADDAKRKARNCESEDQ